MPLTKRSAKPESTGKRSKRVKTQHKPTKGSAVHDVEWGFFKLPRELRDIIYDHVCVFVTRRVLVPCKQAFSGCPTLRQPEPAIAATCRQARAEALEIYYSRNRFAIPIGSFEMCGLDRWISKTGNAYLPVVQDLYIVFGGYSGSPDPRSWMQVRDLFPKDAVNFRGNIYMSAAFKKACEIAEDLRRLGLQWEKVWEVLQKCSEMRTVSCPRGVEWEDPFDFDDEDQWQEIDELHEQFCSCRCHSCGRRHCIDIHGDIEPNDEPVLASDLHSLACHNDSD